MADRRSDNRKHGLHRESAQLANLIPNTSNIGGVPNCDRPSLVAGTVGEDCDFESDSSLARGDLENSDKGRCENNQVTKVAGSSNESLTGGLSVHDEALEYRHAFAGTNEFACDHYEVTGTRLINRKRKRSCRSLRNINKFGEFQCKRDCLLDRGDEGDNDDDDGDDDDSDYVYSNINDDTDSLAVDNNGSEDTGFAYRGDKFTSNSGTNKRRQQDTMVFSRPRIFSFGRVSKDQLNLFPGDDGIGEDNSSDGNNNKCQDTKSKHRSTSLGQIFRNSNDSAQCSRFNSFLRLGGFASSIKKLFESLPDIDPSETDHQTVVELKGCKLRRASENSVKAHEWQQSADTKDTSDEANMLNNYGSNGGRLLKNARRSSHASRRRNSQARLTEGSSSYTKLGYYQYHVTTKDSILQDLRRFILLLIIVAFCAVILWQIYLALDHNSNHLGIVNSPSKLGVFRNYAVSTDAKYCARVGKKLLAKGGHAVDAAIGTLLCMGVVLPNSLGLGGGCLMTIYDNKTKTATIIDGRETAPAYASENMFEGKPSSASRGPLSIGVPGELAAYWEAHQRFGKLNWSDLFTDTIEMASTGVPMVEHMSFALRDDTHSKHLSAQMRELFTNKSTKKFYKEGDILVQSKLADTLKRLRDFGVNEFYNGTTGRLLIKDLQDQGGMMTMDDLLNYRPLVKKALSIKLDDDLRLYTQLPPGSGIVLSVILNIMKDLGYYKNSKALSSFEDANLFYHHLTEAFKFAYAQRAALDDAPEDPRMQELMSRLQSKEFIMQMSSKIDNRTHPKFYYGGLENFQEDHGTAHTSVMDSEGNSVAVTTSVNLYFGSGLMSPSTGIIFNDVMDDFVSPGITNKFMLEPSKYNHIKPGKRPISSMAPSVFVNRDGNPILVVGASGGAKITTAIAIVSLRNIFLGDDIKAAIDAPRIHHQYSPDTVWYEMNFPPEHLEGLANRGHVMQKITGRSSVVMGVACSYKKGTKTITANSDYRKGGNVDGL